MIKIFGPPDNISEYFFMMWSGLRYNPASSNEAHDSVGLWKWVYELSFERGSVRRVPTRPVADRMESSGIETWENHKNQQYVLATVD